MSSFHEHIIQCPSCGAAGTFTVWDSVNTEISPGLRERVLDGSLFRWVCPECGHAWTICSPMLYHAMDRHFMIHFQPRPEGHGAEEKEEPLGRRLMDAVGKAAGGMYTAHSHDELVEKILIHESDFDERGIEYSKYLLFKETAPDGKIPQDGVLRYAGRCYSPRYGEDELDFIYVVNGEQEWGTCIPLSMYKHAMRDPEKVRRCSNYRTFRETNPEEA